MPVTVRRGRKELRMETDKRMKMREDERKIGR